MSTLATTATSHEQLTAPPSNIRDALVSVIFA